jgi:phosphoglycerol transferase MdoB-like AlkP superfamily enzyme
MERTWKLIAALLGALSCAASAVAGESAVSVIENAVPTTIEAGSEISVRLVVANDGSIPWAPDEGYALSYHWSDLEGEIVVWDGRRSPFPDVVAPGSGVELIAVLEAPRVPGEYLLQWDVVQEGVRWLSGGGAPQPDQVRVSVYSGHAFELLHGAVPRIMMTDSVVDVELVLRNQGKRTWLPDGRFAASYHWLGRDETSPRPDGQNPAWEGRRTSFPFAVGTGETVALEMSVEGPRRPGLWKLQWDLVEEGVCWFSDRLAEPPPAETVLVIPDPARHGSWWSLLVLGAAATAVSVFKLGRPHLLIGLFAAGDLLWCAGALSIKQGFVLAEKGDSPSTSGWLLIVGGAAALGLLTFVLPERFRGWARWVMVAGVTLLLWADSVYLRFFGDLPAASALSGIGQLKQTGASIREMVMLRDLWLWLDLLPGLVLILIAIRLRRVIGPRPSQAAAAALGVMVVAGCLAGARLSLTQPTLIGQVFRRTAVAQEIGVLNLHLVDGAGSMARRVFETELDPDKIDEITTWFRETASQRAGTEPLFAVAEGASLVMLQVESLQTFVIGLEIDGQEVTPFLNRWAEDGLWFSNVTDQTGQGRSSDSELMTQASLLPMEGGAAAFRFAANDFTSLADVLSRHGYDTLSAVPFEGAFWNRRQTHAAYGYRRSYFAEDFVAGETVGWGLSDRAFLEQVVKKLVAANRPFAAYLLTLSLHHPFEGFPPQLDTLDVGKWDGTAFGNFLHTMHFFDSSLASFVAALDREGLAGNTVIAVWGDHDAGFPWTEETASAMGAPHDTVGWYLSQEVPLFIRVPGVEWPSAERVVPAGHIDVAPTLLALLGVDPAPYPFLGRNLLGDHGDRPVVGEYGCWRDSKRLFLQGDGALDDGTCIELATMNEVPNTECRAGYESAIRTEEMSALILEHDLQRVVHEALLATMGPGR